MIFQAEKTLKDHTSVQLFANFIRNFNHSSGDQTVGKRIDLLDINTTINSVGIHQNFNNNLFKLSIKTNIKRIKWLD